MAKELIKETGENVGKFVGEFAMCYTMALVTGKIMGAIDDAIAEVIPSAIANKAKEAAGMEAEEEEEAETNEEKAVEDKEDSKSFAAGVMLAGYKSGWGPDDVYHRYYDMAVFNIKEKDSVIAKITYRHRTLMNFAYKETKKAITAPEFKKLPVFPKKKRMGKKDYAYYRARYTGMDAYFEQLCLGYQSFCTSAAFLDFFKLRFDEKALERRELFLGALESIATKEGINWEWSMRRAQRLGLDADECEMLKVVAIAKVGKEAKNKLYEMVITNGPAYMPGPVRNKTYNSMRTQLAGVIGTTVETGWNAAKESFKKVADTLSEAMDKAAEKLKELFAKILGPLKKLIDEKLASKEEEEESKEETLEDKLQKLGVARFGPVAAAMKALKEGGKCASVVGDLQSAICDLNHVWKYTPYIQYNCGNPDIVQWFPPIEKITDKYMRLTIALIDVVYVLGRGMCRALGPLAEYADKAADSFDEKGHAAEVQKAVLLGGRKLALDYFSLPYTTWRSTWYCGNKVTNAVLTYGRQTVNMQADILGTVAAKWKPTSNSDVKSTLAAVLEEALEPFLCDRAFTAVMLVRETAANMIANLFLSVVGDAIETIGSGVDEIMSNLPPPLSDLKAGDLVTNTLESMVEKAAGKVVAKWAKKSETFMVGDGGDPEAGDEGKSKGLRFAPVIRNDDDDLAKEEEDEEAEEDGDKGEKNKDSDNEEDGVKSGDEQG